MGRARENGNFLIDFSRSTHSSSRLASLQLPRPAIQRDTSDGFALPAPAGLHLVHDPSGFGRCRVLQQLDGLVRLRHDHLESIAVSGSEWHDAKQYFGREHRELSTAKRILAAVAVSHCAPGRAELKVSRGDGNFSFQFSLPRHSTARASLGRVEGWSSS